VCSDNATLLLPPWTVSITADVLRAVGIHPLGASWYACDADEVVWDHSVSYMDNDPQPQLDPIYPTIFVNGHPTLEPPCPLRANIRGAYMDWIADDDEANEPEDEQETACTQRTGADFENTQHGCVFSYLAYSIVPSILHVSKASRNQWKKNTRRRYFIRNNHLNYRACLRPRKRRVRNIMLIVHPTRIIPFADELDAVCTCTSRVHTHLYTTYANHT
jgi:hypothetical protein